MYALENGEDKCETMSSGYGMTNALMNSLQLCLLHLTNPQYKHDNPHPM